MSKNNPYSPYFYKKYKESELEKAHKNVELITDFDKISVKSRKKQSRVYKRNKRGAIALLLIMICFFSTVLCADYFTSGVILAVFEPKTMSADAKVYYAVRIGYFSDKKTAEAYSEEVSARAAAGYVRCNENYSVIAAVYKDSDRAIQVVDRMIKSNMAATITAIEIKSFYSEFLNNSTQKKCETGLNTFDEVYDVLLEISNKLDDGRLSETDAMNEIKNLISYVNDKKNTFEYATANCAHLAVGKIGSAISLIVKRLEEIGKTDYVYLSSPVRYAYTAVIYDYHDLCNDLAKLN